MVAEGDVAVVLDGDPVRRDVPLDFDGHILPVDNVSDDAALHGYTPTALIPAPLPRTDGVLALVLAVGHHNGVLRPLHVTDLLRDVYVPTCNV